MPRTKRNKGGQPGNRNARTHGYYSKTTLPEDSPHIFLASRLPGLDAEIALLRCRLRFLYHNDSLKSEPFLRTTAQLRLALLARKKLSSRRPPASHGSVTPLPPSPAPVFPTENPPCRENSKGPSGNLDA